VLLTVTVAVVLLPVLVKLSTVAFPEIVPFEAIVKRPVQIVVCPVALAVVASKGCELKEKYATERFPGGCVTV
jgi:hypothetical protein